MASPTRRVNRDTRAPASRRSGRSSTRRSSRAVASSSGLTVGGIETDLDGVVWRTREVSTDPESVTTAAGSSPSAPEPSFDARLESTLTDPAESGLLLVTTPEELAVQETREAIAQIDSARQILIAGVVGTLSAAIAAAGGGVLADTIGVFKELDDSRGGSGFSFIDLLADRDVDPSGLNLGHCPTSSATEATPEVRPRRFVTVSS